MVSTNKGINGDPAALLIDRAIGELRRGRAIQLVESGKCVVIAAAETVRAPLFERLGRQAAGEPALAITPERARALDLAADDKTACLLPLAPTWELEDVRALAGASVASLPTIKSASGSPRSHEAPIHAGLLLAKAGRLVPALIVLTMPADFEDQSLLRVETRHIAPFATFSRHSLRRVSQARVPLADAVDCEVALFRDEHALGEHVAVIIGKPDNASAIPVRLHSACFTGDLLGSLRCDCGEQLRTAVTRISALGGGVLLYLDQEGRGIGLPNKLRAYALQDAGLDTLDADRHLGFLDDERNYDVAAILLKELGFTKIELLTNNPRKIAALVEHGIEVTGRLPLVASTNTHNERYLKAKRERAGHLAEESGR